MQEILDGGVAGNGAAAQRREFEVGYARQPAFNPDLFEIVIAQPQFPGPLKKRQLRRLTAHHVGDYRIHGHRIVGRQYQADVAKVRGGGAVAFHSDHGIHDEQIGDAQPKDFNNGLMKTFRIAGSFVQLWGVDWSFTLRHFAYSWDVGATTMGRTVMLALISTPITAFLGMIIAFLVVRRRFVGRHFMELLAMLSYAIPGTAIGIGYVLAFNGAPFRWSGTAFILVTAYVFRNVPIGVEGGIAALKQISSEIEESSTNLGANSAYTFRTVTLPLIRPAFFAGATFAFVRAMTAISAIIFLVSARWNHMTVLILAQTEILRLGAASVMSFALIVVVMSVIFLIMKLTGLERSQVFGAGAAR